MHDVHGKFVGQTITVPYQLTAPMLAELVAILGKSEKEFVAFGQRIVGDRPIEDTYEHAKTIRYTYGRRCEQQPDTFRFINKLDV